jgi:predicted acylesterase/phospholipase RssA
MTRIALVLGGGASLGSYIGGAVTEVIRAVQGNRRKDTVVIDVITGASAGALNAALAARCLSVNRNLLPWIEKAWVDAADASVLLDPARPQREGWLDVSVLDELTRGLVDSAAASDDEPSRAAGSSIRLGFTLANLYGVPYDRHYRFLNEPDRSFGTRVHTDSIRFQLTKESRAGAPVWSEVADAAVASASFPFAFPPRQIGRSTSDYPGARLSVGPDGKVDMWYLDGGLFDNAPLGLARDLVELEGGHQGHDRRYLFVEPALESAGPGHHGFDGPPSTLGGMASALAKAVLGQGAAKDWATANRINTRLEILRALVERLPDLAPDLADPGAFAIGRYIGELAEHVAEVQVAELGSAGSESDDPAGDHLDAAVERIEADPAYASALSSADSRAARARLAKLVFVLEAAAGLQDKDVLPLYLVAPKDGQVLAGDFLGHFGGFFHRDWRANDFRAGRRDARRVIEETLQDVISYDPGDKAEYRVDKIDPGFDSIPAAGKARLRELADGEAARMLAELKPGPLAAAFGWAWKPVVRRWAADRALAALRGAR